MHSSLNRKARLTTRLTQRAACGAALLCGLVAAPSQAAAQIAILGETVHTMAGPAITNGIVVIEDGKITQVGSAASVTVPAGLKTLTAKVVTPGLVDAHTVVGLSGHLNQPHDQDQIELSTAMQPELRAIDGYNPREMLVEWVREFGVTTIHTGHGPGTLISGQTMIAKTRGDTVDEAVVVPAAMVAATLGEDARAERGKSPGTRSKMIAMLREEFVKARAYTEKSANADEAKKPERNLRSEAFSRILRKELPLLVTVHRANDIMSAIRLAKEFDIRLVLDGAAEAYLILDQIRESGYPVILHPTMYRANGDTENLSFETASKLRQAGIPFALQSGFEGYVPKTRVLLYEAGVSAANGQSFDDALRSVTIDAAQIIGMADRIGSLEPGKDGDVALYDGDPFEYTTHCVGVVIEGEVVSEVMR